MKKSLDRLTRQALNAMYVVEIAEVVYGPNHKYYQEAQYRYRKALRALGERMTDVYGYPFRRIGPRAVDVEKLRKAG